jgi:signal transduction histidine kinase
MTFKYFFPILCFYFHVLKAQDPIILTKGNTNQIIVGKNILVLNDEGEMLDSARALTTKDYYSSKNNVPNVGFTDGVIWVKFKVQNQSTDSIYLIQINQSNLDEIIFYDYSDKNELSSVQFSGEKIKIDQRKYKDQYPIFDTKIPINTTHTYLLKISSGEQILLPLQIADVSGIQERNRNRDILYGIYFGIIIVMMAYNFFLYFTLRDKNYLFYVVYIFFVGLTQAVLEGYCYKFIWTNNYWLATRSVYFSSAFVSISAIVFLRYFLHTKEYASKLDNLANYLMVFLAICIFSSYYEVNRFSHNFTQVGIVLVSIYIFSSSLVVLRKGYRPAKFFFIAWFILVIGIFIFVLKDAGIIEANNYTTYTLPIGSALETLLLSFALADRINILKKEKELSQAEALKISEENQKLVSEQNIVLELKVHERTLELEGANVELNHTLNNLKDAQTQLVNAEKMASLGQLTAGIAHEINNPINFVSSNLKPLKLDIAEILLVIQKYESINPKLEIESQLLEIEKLKKKLDLNYLKTEINTLLNGIEDGARRTTEIVSGLRNFSRLDESQINFANINEGIDSTLVIVRSSIPHKVEVITEYGELPLVECYAGKINQVFMNILTNAIFAIKQKESMNNEKIIIKTYLENDLVCASFTDTGSGMSEEVKQKIFEPFFTTKGVGEGTGLGMSIVFKIVETHHAILEVESEVGKGTTFILKLNQSLNLPS